MAPNLDINPLPVALHGISERMQQTLAYLFKGPGKNHYRIVEDEKSDVRILDVDSFEGKQLFNNNLGTLLGKPLIILSLNKITTKDFIFIQKPVKSEALISALSEIANTLNQGSVKTRQPSERKTNKTLQTKKALPANEKAADRQRNTHAKPGKKRLSTNKPEALKPSESTKPASSAKQTRKFPVKGRSVGDKISAAKAAAKKSHQTPLATVNPVTRSQKHSPPKAQNTKRAVHFPLSFKSSSPDIDLEDQTQLHRLSYNPENYFQGYISDIIEKAFVKQKIAQIFCPEGMVFILPDKKTILIDEHKTRLQAFCSIPVSNSTLSNAYISKKTLEKNKKTTEKIPVRALLWKTAVWASRGRLPVNTDIHEQATTLDWSSVSQGLPLFEHAEKIGATWEQQDYSLLEITRILKIPQRYIFTFYSACLAIGILQTKNNSGLKSKQKKTLQARINDYLFPAITKR